jgi:hypothetical protein
LRAASIIACLFALIGCSAPGQQYQRAGGSQSELEQDQRGCRGESSRFTKDAERRQTNSMIDSGARIGVGSIETDQLAGSLRDSARQAFEQCMARRGWVLRKKDAS